MRNLSLRDTVVADRLGVGAGLVARTNSQDKFMIREVHSRS